MERAVPFRSIIWNMALCAESAEFALERRLGKPVKLFSSKKRRLRRAHVHTRADPFLYAADGKLHLFFESKSVGEPGRIEAYRTSDLEDFEHLGTILEEPHHLSYPFVFGYEGEHYLIPESGGAGEVALYCFARFPFEPVKLRVLLKGAYFDSSLIRHNGCWFLFTTSSRGLEIFSVNDLLDGTMCAHPANPISTDPRYMRSGGAPICLGNTLFRIAQDCAKDYGRHLHIFRVLTLTESAYEETLLTSDYLSSAESWNSLGGHHLSIADFNGRTIVAVDGKQYDYLLNKLSGMFFRLMG